MFRFAEFFAGGGMVSAALADKYECAFANDIDPMKCATYRQNWNGDVLVCGDVAMLSSAHLQQPIDLYWASTPCQDLSLAGKGSGITGRRSGVFFDWIALVTKAKRAGYAPRIIAFENVTGLISRSGGKDFTAVLEEFRKLGYRFGALEIDASLFLPQSRPRVFVIAIRDDISLRDLSTAEPSTAFHSRKIQNYLKGAPETIRRNWIWWCAQPPSAPVQPLGEMLEDNGIRSWKPSSETGNLISMMSEVSIRKLENARSCGERRVLTAYKRGRPDGSGKIRQRAELRDDGIAGCLRTPGGGSSRQTIILVDKMGVRSRLFSARETARLMGLDDSYIMPSTENDGYRITGDGVAVPVVRFLAERIFDPILSLAAAKKAA